VLRGFKFICLAALAGQLTLPSGGQVISTDTARIRLDEVTITATRIPENSRQLMRISRIISRKEIETAPVHDLSDLLEYVTDIDVRQRGPSGVQADVSLRGGTFDQFAILINGINFSDPQTGHFQMDIPIPLAMVQRIEILSGSDVKSLGSNAFCGAINIVTGAPEQKNVHASLYSGQHGFLEAGLDAGTRSAKWWNHAGILLIKSDGYRQNTDFKNLNGYFQSGYSHRLLHISVMAGGLKKAFGANSFYTAKYPNQYEKTGSGFAAIQGEYLGKLNIRQSFYYRLHTDEFSLFRTDPPSWYLSPNYHLSQTAGSKSDAWFSSAWGKTALGFEFRHESVWSTVLGEVASEPRQITGVDAAVYSRYGSRSHYSLSAEQYVVTGKINWHGGLVLHEVQSLKNYFQIYPGVDISLAATDSWRTFVSFNRAFRMPTFTELYYQSPTNRGNISLMPETAWHAETGAEYRNGGFSAKLAGFYRYASQSIDWVRTADETIWHTENLGRIRTSGVESGLSWLPVKQAGAWKFVDRLDMGYRHYFQHHAVESYYSQYVLDYLKWKFTTGVTLKIMSSLRFTANLVWQERNGTYTSYDSDQNMVEVDYRPFMVVDIKLSYRYKWAGLVAECSNLFNREYFDLSSIPLPGAWFKAGLEVNLFEKH